MCNELNLILDPPWSIAGVAGIMGFVDPRTRLPGPKRRQSASESRESFQELPDSPTLQRLSEREQPDLPSTLASTARHSSFRFELHWPTIIIILVANDGRAIIIMRAARALKSISCYRRCRARGPTPSGWA